jgi:hypothetical protein
MMEYAEQNFHFPSFCVGGTLETSKLLSIKCTQLAWILYSDQAVMILAFYGRFEERFKFMQMVTTNLMLILFNELGVKKQKS